MPRDSSLARMRAIIGGDVIMNHDAGDESPRIDWQTGSLINRMYKFLAANGGVYSPSEIAAEIDANVNTVRTYLKRLHKNKRVIHHGHGRWSSR